MLEIGKYNDLHIVKKVPFGVYLDGEELDEILLPQKYVPQDAEVGDLITVFVHLDSEDRLIATTRRPKAIVGDFKYLKIVSNSEYGAFADWGLEKDLFIPFREQNQNTIPGRGYLTYVYFDQESGRIAGSHKYYKYLSGEISSLEEGMEVDIIVFESTEIGYKVLINQIASGLLYKSELFNSNIRPGYEGKAFIKKIREDGKIDVVLQKQGYGQVLDFSDVLLERVQQEGGYLSITDKSSPELIYDYFGVSKKVFKKAVGKLYKARKIRIMRDGIELVK